MVVNSLQHSADLPHGPECLSRGPSLFGEEKNSLDARNIQQFRSDLLPLEVKWACICARKELRFTQDECVVGHPGCCFF